MQAVNITFTRVATMPTSDGSCVRQHADGALNLGEIATGDDRRWLVVDTDFETCWAPIDELNCSLGLDRCNGCIDILGHHITTVEQTACHVLSYTRRHRSLDTSACGRQVRFTVTRIAFDHLVGWLEDSIGDLSHSQLLVVGFLS